MDEVLLMVKDFLLVLSPIIVAFFSYRSNKKTEKDVRLEIEKSLKERDAETEQILHKINAELESQKQLATWNSSLPQTDEYIKLAGAERYGNISSLSSLADSINKYIDSNDLSRTELDELRLLLDRVKLPIDDEKLYTYEVMHIISYNQLLRRIDRGIEASINS